MQNSILYRKKIFNTPFKYVGIHFFSSSVLFLFRLSVSLIHVLFYHINRQILMIQIKKHKKWDLT